MIQTTELRIGNYIKYSGQNKRIRSISKEGISIDKKGKKFKWLKYDEFKPIPLSKILEFAGELELIEIPSGFILKTENYIFNFRTITPEKSMIYISNNYQQGVEGVGEIGFRTNWLFIELSYLHQFQNLYFDLIQQELKIEL